jgi:hypothetical protein
MLLVRYSAVPRLYITDAPPLTPPLHDEARRFVTFLDVAYEHRTQLVIAASASSAAGECAWELAGLLGNCYWYWVAVKY